MRESIQDSITRLLRYQRSPISVTSRFRTWKHNADILPRLQSQLEMILTAYGKFEPIVYDTQGIRDEGADIVLRYNPEGYSDQQKIIGFQAKSYDDIGKPDYLQSLKAQRDDAFRRVNGLRYYFIVLCTDAKAHKDKIRQIAAEFKTADRTEVIEPAFAYTFLHYPKTRLEAWIKRTMEEGDLVFKLALESLRLTSPFARALAVFLTVRFVLSGSPRFWSDKITANPVLKNIHEQLSEQQLELLSGDQVVLDDDDEFEPIALKEFEQQTAEDLELLEGDLLDVDSDSDEIVLRTDQLRPLVAVVADALARYEHTDNELMSYMFSVMGVGE